MLAAFQIVHLNMVDTRMSVGGIKYNLQLSPRGLKLLPVKNDSDDYTRQTEQSHDGRVHDVEDPLAERIHGSVRVGPRCDGVWRNRSGRDCNTLEQHDFGAIDGRCSRWIMLVV
jgi:hypothetical protein